MDEESERLKRCPFCSGEAQECYFDEQDDPNWGGSCIECTKCGASSAVEFNFKETLYECWNRRPPVEGARGGADWPAFGREIMQNWPIGDIDGFELQEVAVKHRVIVEVPGGYDPEKHGEDDYGAELGDRYFQRNYSRDALSAPAQPDPLVEGSALPLPDDGGEE